MKLLRLSISLIILIVLSSCIQPLQLEDLGVVISRGVDKNEEEKIEVNMAVLQFNKDSPSTTKTIDGVGETIQGAIKNANTKANQYLANGKLELEIYGRQVAEEGLEPFIDTLRRDANIPSTVFLAVSDTTAKEIFTIDTEKIDINLGQFLHEIIQPGPEKRLFPVVTFPRFLYTINNSGIEPVLPIMEVKDGNPALSGVALFKGDKMVSELPLKDAILISIMEGTVRNEIIEITIPKEELSAELQKDTKRDRLKMTFIIEQARGNNILTNKEELKYDTKIDLKLNLIEIFPTYKLEEEKVINDIERAIEKHIKDRYETLLSKLKELNIDTFGYGIKYRIKNKGGKLTAKEWDELFPKIDTTIDVKAEIIRHGSVHR
ncbi:Ger(x)C family spore germination protein [Ornithinibacillus halotolerans]|uniref:Ger(X)C family spore germination protein n=1 Tax=Ornithinibacillus halotolerans TaxID=1274357 RepID=A0A916WCJ6_9BACI|nr:Ger(x)C family spore germination protein [Ornithinibacillus halotolerans]GGA85776.1 hypothetical protein GCM10008025_30960 [Ornithinibacillus halotolerans]